MIIPNQVHNLDVDAYFIRKRWDYFVKHLLGDMRWNPDIVELNLEK